MRWRVLIVDDEKLLARAMCDVLSDHHHVEHAPSVAAARRRLGEPGAFDVVLCDVQLPDGHAGQVHDVFRQTHPGARFVLVTGGDASVAQALSCGACPVLRKPFDLEQLPALLAALVA
ncbi:MAG TPA: response regulator [Kofleriaceae bacterium]|nr:response regulator [Kofleriaceae bacterium]